jgi:hypothetical protein
VLLCLSLRYPLSTSALHSAYWRLSFYPNAVRPVKICIRRLDAVFSLACIMNFKSARLSDFLLAIGKLTLWRHAATDRVKCSQ